MRDEGEGGGREEERERGREEGRRERESISQTHENSYRTAKIIIFLGSA